MSFTSGKSRFFDPLPWKWFDKDDGAHLWRSSEPATGADALSFRCVYRPRVRAEFELPPAANANAILVFFREYHEPRMLPLRDSARAFLASWGDLSTVDDSDALDQARAHRVLTLLSKLERTHRHQSRSGL